MMPVIMDDSVEDVELCLENYRCCCLEVLTQSIETKNVFRTLIYNGMLDIIVHHTGVEDMILDLNWSGLEKYKYKEFY